MIQASNFCFCFLYLLNSLLIEKSHTMCQRGGGWQTEKKGYKNLHLLMNTHYSWFHLFQSIATYLSRNRIILLKIFCLNNSTYRTFTSKYTVVRFQIVFNQLVYLIERSLRLIIYCFDSGARKSTLNYCTCVCVNVFVLIL